LRSSLLVIALAGAAAGRAWSEDAAPNLQATPASQETPAPAPAPAAAPPAVTASVPFRFYGNVHLREDFTRLEDRADLLLDGNQVDGLLVRVRAGAEFKDASATVSGGLRVSTGETPNPASPFVRLGDAARPVGFGFDQFYVDVRPFRNKSRVHGVFGKMPQPFWRGDKGVIRAEMTWDDDISPVGGIVQAQLYKKGEGASETSLENVAGYFIVEWFRRARFAGLVGDTSLWADQLKLKTRHVTVATALYHWENLNSGAYTPSFVPGQSASLLPGTSAFLLRSGFQVTNGELDLGSGVKLFRKNAFDIFEATAQGTMPVGKYEVVVVGQYLHNFSVESERNGVGISVGLVGGSLKGKLKPFSLHGTWRRVETDAAIAAFADSDLGAGTDVKGFEITGEYKVHKNLSLTVSHFNFDGAPMRSTDVKRTFLGMIWDF
jgi:hypothetical protein